MTAPDRHTIQLDCPACDIHGEARVADNDGYTFMRHGPQRHVDTISEGFRFESGPQYPLYPMESAGKFFCRKCGAEV